MSEECHSLLRRNGRVLADVGSVSADFINRHVIPEHHHPEDQLIFASSGVMTVSSQQGIWVVPPLRAVWIPAWTPHSIATSGAVSMRTLYFLPKITCALPKKCFVIHVSPLLRELIVHACQVARLSRKRPRQQSLIDMIVMQVKSAHAIPLQLPHPTDPRAARVVRVLLTNPGDERTLDRLSIDCGASKRTIQRVFIAETRMTFGRWRQQLRLLHAMRLLASGEKVSTAALDAGYHSTSAFVSMFRKQLGTTPANYFRH